MKRIQIDTASENV